MKIEYDKTTKNYELRISIMDKCYTCGYYLGEDNICPLIKTIQDQELLIRRNDFNMKNCELYFYLIPKAMEDKMQGFYLGDEGDRGYTDHYKYK